MRYQKTSSGPKPCCRYCTFIELRRQGRTGLWQTLVLTRLGYYPWECGQCRRIFLLRQRYVYRPRLVRETAPNNHSAPELLHGG